MGWTTRKFEFDSRLEYRHILFCTMPRPLLGCRVFSIRRTPDVDWPGLEAYHCVPSAAEVNDSYSYTSAPAYIGMACLVRLRAGTNYPSLLNRKSFV